MTDVEARLAAIRQRRAALESLPWDVNEPDGLFNERPWLVGPRVFPRDRTERADMEFIAHAPEDIQWLIGKVEEVLPVITANEQLGAELVRLRGLLKELEWCGLEVVCASEDCDCRQFDACPECSAREGYEPHREGCRLTAAIKEQQR